MNVVKKLHKKRIALLVLFSLLVGSATSYANDRAAGRDIQTLRPSLSSLKLDTPQYIKDAQASNPVLDASLVGASGRQMVIVHLKKQATSALSANNAYLRGSQKLQLMSEQTAFVGRCQAEDASIKEIGRVQHLLNAVFLDVPASALPSIARDPEVQRIAPVGHYEMDLSETVSYVGAAAVQASGLDGSGVSVAVLDSGVDYTHADLGGSGDPEDYAGNDGTVIEPGTFPTAKVVAGYDFIGNVWPNGPGGASDPPLLDPDPIDDLALIPGSFAGHGTHVADIIAGNLGVAPGASIYAVKVCASLASSCNGISLILGMEYSVDPDGDGDTSDHVDIINMSLGATYGQPFDDDLSAAVEAASALGVLTVSSAGNCGDAPYCTGTPSSAPSALSVAQTEVPSAKLFLMNLVEPEPSAGLYNTVKYPWTPDPVANISGPVMYGDEDGTNLDGCAPFSGDLSGKIVAVDRGACAFSQKVRNIEQAGGVVGIVMLIAPGAPFPGGFGGGDPINIPGFNVGQADGDLLRSGSAIVEFGPDLTAPLVGTTVGSTARGPDMSFNAIKPEIGAPGASISAEVGTGTERTPFGGTSGASPMVAGAAALLQQMCRGDYEEESAEHNEGCAPHELKALLMNNAYRDIISDTTGELTEITRIGGGELRVDASAAATFMAYTKDSYQPSISLGLMDVDKIMIKRKKVTVTNMSDKRQQIKVKPTFRFDEDKKSRAVRIFPKKRTLSVPAHGSRTFSVIFVIDPNKLGGNPMTSGAEGNDPATLTTAEYDGYLNFKAKGGEQIAMPWHVIPRQAAKVRRDRGRIQVGGFPDTIGLTNNGAGVAQNDAYNIIALSDELPRGGPGMQMPTPDIRAVGMNTIPIDSAICSSEFLWLFAINTWDRQTHLMPVSHQVVLDIDRDGIDDYVLLNRDFTFNNVTDGRQLSWVLDLSTGEAGAFFFAEHATNTANTVLLACGEQFGLSAADLGVTSVNASVIAQDFYNGGPGDAITGLTVTPLGERFLGLPSGDLPAWEAGSLDIYDFGSLPTNSAEPGVMLLTNGDRGPGAHGGATEKTEALLFLTPGVKKPAPLPE